MKILKYMYLNKFYNAEIEVYDNCTQYNIYSCTGKIINSDRIYETNIDKIVEQIGEFYDKLDLKKPTLSDFIITSIEIDSFLANSSSYRISVEKTYCHKKDDLYFILLDDKRCSNNFTYNEAIEKAKLLVSILK